MSPIIIIAGTGLWGALYRDLKKSLDDSEKVLIVPISALDWIGFPPSPSRSTNRIMAMLHQCVTIVESTYPNEPITLLAHSGGGTIALIYLLGKSFQGDCYKNKSITKLVTLGTPFKSAEQFARQKSDFIESYLDEAFLKQVEIISIASSCRKGNRNGTAAERLAFELYRNSFGIGDLDGDGVVPIDACRLRGSKEIIIESAEHLPNPLAPWYGSEIGVEQWKKYVL